MRSRVAYIDVQPCNLGIEVLNDLFGVFSRRQKASPVAPRKSLTSEFRNRVILLLRDHLGGSFGEFLHELHRQLGYLHGRPQLTKSSAATSSQDDVFAFLFSCPDEHFLDAIEIMFKGHFQGISWPSNPLIPAINQFFAVDDLPYHLTGYTITESQSSGRYGGTSIELTEYPRIIRKDSQAIQQGAIEPTLQLLGAKVFQHANAEYLKALEDHRKGDYADCLVKCGSAFESVMKVLCDKRGIAFKQTDTASTLLKALLAKSELDTFWEQPLTLIATVRNRLSSAHGAGIQAKVVPPHVATYALNATACAILLLVGEFP